MLEQTVSALYTFFLAMTLNPEVQKKAQEEISRVVGEDRLPTFADRENLPYIGALIKEVLRWNPVGPLGESLSTITSFPPAEELLNFLSPQRSLTE